MLSTTYFCCSYTGQELPKNTQNRSYIIYTLQIAKQQETAKCKEVNGYLLNR